MRTIDGDALTKRLIELCNINCPYTAKARNIMCGSCFMGLALEAVEDAPAIDPERKKDTVQKFHDYQVEWLLSHCDLELEPQLEEWVVHFLHDTANCYMMEIDRKEGDTP